jgi:hypothetical protein
MFQYVLQSYGVDKEQINGEKHCGFSFGFQRFYLRRFIQV